MSYFGTLVSKTAKMQEFAKNRRKTQKMDYFLVIFEGLIFSCAEGLPWPQSLDRCHVWPLGGVMGFFWGAGVHFRGPLEVRGDF